MTHDVINIYPHLYIYIYYLKARSRLTVFRKGLVVDQLVGLECRLCVMMLLGDRQAKPTPPPTPPCGRNPKP